MNALSILNPFRSSVWDPIRELGALENRLEKYLGRTPLTGNGGDSEAMAISQWSPLVDITEDAKEYILTAELPELKKEDVKVIVENGELTISGERKFEKEEKDMKYHRIERSYGSFIRSFTLPEGVTGEKVVADFKDGMLKVHLPKDENAKPKTIEVKVQ
jgi:HSP20 family protein